MFEKEAKRSFDELDDRGIGDDWSTEEAYVNGFSNGAELGYGVGLEAGKPKWHDLRKNPEDLPPMYDLSASLSQNVLLDIGIIGYYSHNQKRWCVSMGHRIIKGVIAWCEIPKFKEE